MIDELKPYLKEGIDEAEVTSKLEGLNPLNGLQTKEDAWSFIESNKLLKSAFDSKQSKAAETVEERLMAGKVQELLKAKEEELRLELNPQETEAAKIAREFKEYKDAQERKESMSALQEKLSDVAKEVSYDPLKARDYAVYGEKAEEKLREDAEWLSYEIERRLAEESKTRFGGNQQPKKKVLLPADIDTKIKEARASGDHTLAMKLQLQKQKQSQ